MYRKCSASRLLIKDMSFAAAIIFRYVGDFILPIHCGSHVDYHNFVVTNLRNYYADPNALARSTWDIIQRF